jgi:hypothetical protein
MAFSVVLASADDSCPKVVPSSFEIFLPASLPAGMRPYVREKRMGFIACGPKGSDATPFLIWPTGTASVSIFHVVEHSAGSESDFRGPASFGLDTYNDDMQSPPPRAGDINVQAAGRTVVVPVKVVFTDEPIARSENFTLEFENATSGPSGQELAIWFDNAKSAVAYTATSDLPFLTVAPASGSGFARLWVQADFSKIAAGNYFGNVILTAPGVANSPLKIPVRVFAASPEFWPALGPYALYAVEGGKNPDPIPSSVQSIRQPLNTIIASDSKWLTASPASGTTPFDIKISADVTGLPAGTYTGKLTFSAQGAPSGVALVHLTVWQKP